MSNAVLIQNPSSAYKDEPGVRYHFPKRYLRRLEACVGDWVIFYEGKTGALGYVAVQKLRDITPDPDDPGHFYANLERDTLWQFEQVVPRNSPMGLAFEHALRGQDGRAMTGGHAVSAVRSISFGEFSDIVQAGLQPLDGPNALPRDADPPALVAPGFADAPQPFEYPGLSDLRQKVLMSRDARDRSFARMVKAAYDGRCAISGLDLRNGFGRAEVQAAHIRPVKHAGPDVVQNGLALSATLH
ncbi:MAG: HNH endonuclease [Marinibacterium sp.]|nr:HNH endonuclease [Marinibacterium sp.]